MADKTSIVDIIRRHALEPGRPMLDVFGKTIPDSAVLDGHSFVHRDDAGYRLFGEKPILGERYDLLLAADAMAALRGITF